MTTHIQIKNAKAQAVSRNNQELLRFSILPYSLELICPEQFGNFLIGTVFNGRRNAIFY